MQLTSFSLMRPIRLFKKDYTIVGILEDKRLVLRNEDGIDKTWEIEALIGHYLTGNLKHVVKHIRSEARFRPLKIASRLASDVSEHAKKEAFERKEYLEAIAQTGVRLRANSTALRQVLEAVSVRLGRTRSPSTATLKRWRALQNFKGNDPAALVPYFERRGGSGRSRLPEATDLAIEAVIDNTYMTDERLSARRVHDELQARLAERNKWLPAEKQHKLPSYATLLRRLRRRPGYDLVAARQGARQAELTYRSASPSSEDFTFNECWEIDHTILDLFVVDTHTGLPLGRPRFTAVIEYTTRALMGFDLDFSGASAQATLNCLKHAMLPKSYLREQHPQVQGEWPCFGLPQVLKCDNGVEFHSVSVKDACFELGIELQYCPVKQPWYKGRIERFFRTFNESALSGLPGSTGSHYYQRAEGRDAAELAVIGLHELHAYLHVWIVDVYLSTLNRGSQMSPLVAWNQRFEIHKAWLPLDPTQLDMICAETCTRVVSHIGIELENCKFNSHELQEMRRRAPLPDLHLNAANSKVRSQALQVKYNKALMAAIWVTDPRDGIRLRVPNTDPQTADLSAAQIAAISKHRRDARDAGHQLSTAAARQRLRDGVRHMVNAKTQGARRRALKLLGVAQGDARDGLVAPKVPTRQSRRSLEADVIEPKLSEHVDAATQSSTLHETGPIPIPKYDVIFPRNATARRKGA